jgi:hypothetical protein
MYHKFVWEKGIQGGIFIKLIKTLKIKIMEKLEEGDVLVSKGGKKFQIKHITGDDYVLLDMNFDYYEYTLTVNHRKIEKYLREGLLDLELKKETIHEIW